MYSMFLSHAGSLLCDKYRIQKGRACGWMTSAGLRCSPREPVERIDDADDELDSNQE